MHRPRPIGGGLVLAALALAGCGGDDPVAPPGPPAAVHVTGAAGVIGVGDTVRLAALVVDASGRPVPGAAVTWRSLDTAVVRGEGAGVAIGWEAGRGGVVAAIGTLADTVAFRVELLPRRLEIAGAGTDSLQLFIPFDITLRVRDGRGRLLVTSGAHVAVSDTTRLHVAWPQGSDSLRLRFTGLLPGTDSIVATLGGTRFATAVRFRPTPVAMAGTSVAPGALGPYHACSVDAGGAATCWGQNDYGQLGSGTLATTTAAQPPAPVTGDHRFAAIVTSVGSTCGITRVQQRLLCWGYDIAGAYDATPRVMFEGSEVIQVSLASNGGPCALTTTSAVYCWLHRLDAPREPGFQGDPGALTTISGNCQHLCVLSSAGRPWCGSVGSQLAQVPGSYPPLRQLATSSAATSRFACGLTAAGEAWCWGDNRYGQLGRTPLSAPGDASAQPAGAVQTSARFTSLVVGRTLSCGLATSGQVLCWGSSPSSATVGSYQPMARYLTPVPLLGDEQFTALHGGPDKAPCGVLANGDLRCIDAAPRPTR